MWIVVASGCSPAGRELFHCDCTVENNYCKNCTNTSQESFFLELCKNTHLCMPSLVLLFIWEKKWHDIPSNKLVMAVVDTHLAGGEGGSGCLKHCKIAPTEHANEKLPHSTCCGGVLIDWGWIDCCEGWGKTYDIGLSEQGRSWNIVEYAGR